MIAIQNAPVGPAVLTAAHRNRARVHSGGLSCFIKGFPSQQQGVQVAERGGGYNLSQRDPTEAEHKNSLAKPR